MHGKCPFDYVKDHREWIDSGYFNEEINARLKGMLMHCLLLKHTNNHVVGIASGSDTNALRCLCRSLYFMVRFAIHTLVFCLCILFKLLI